MKLHIGRTTIAGLLLSTAFCYLPSSMVQAAPAEAGAVPIMLAQAEAIQADHEEFVNFLLPKLNEILLVLWDVLEAGSTVEPDIVLKYSNQMNAEWVSPQLKAKIAKAVQQATAQKQSGKPVSPSAIAELEATEKRALPRLEQLVQQLCTGAKPRILKLAHKDPSIGKIYCSLMQNFLNSLNGIINPQNLNMYQQMFNDLSVQIEQLR